MAGKLGLDGSYLADMERGKRNIALMNLEVITFGFELTLSQLLSRV
jgi:transcriptional regulator with XRE-family HTH domain